MPRLALTPPLIEQIAAGVRAGGYPHVAAQAWGVPRGTFEDWMSKGAKGRGACGLLAKTMGEAHAQARLRSEMLICRDDPRIWLEHGPARDQPNNPGWSSSARPVASPETSPLAYASVMSAIGGVIGNLSEHPEAREIIANSLESHIS
jgi:hypothetical protein